VESVHGQGRGWFVNQTTVAVGYGPNLVDARHLLSQQAVDFHEVLDHHAALVVQVCHSYHQNLIVNRCPAEVVKLDRSFDREIDLHGLRELGCHYGLSRVLDGYHRRLYGMALMVAQECALESDHHRALGHPLVGNHRLKTSVAVQVRSRGRAAVERVIPMIALVSGHHHVFAVQLDGKGHCLLLARGAWLAPTQSEIH
jgi:glutamate mutase epsilon subunit